MGDFETTVLEMNWIEVATSIFGLSGFSFSALLMYRQKKQRGNQENYALILENLRNGMKSLTEALEATQAALADEMQKRIADQKKIVALERTVAELKRELSLFRCMVPDCMERVPPLRLSLEEETEAPSSDKTDKSYV